MTPINLFLIDMSHATNTSGVDRYMETLISGLGSIPEIQVHWIHLRKDDDLLFPKLEKIDHYLKYSIPIPQQHHTMIAERFWIRKYNEQVFRLTKSCFEGKENCIIHLHTLNLIDLAVYIKEQINCKIITHLHCIPWKGLYNRDKKRFNRLYELTYTNTPNVICDPEIYVTNNCELQSYSAPDALICVTHSGLNFVQNCIRSISARAYVILNGIRDFAVNKSEIKKAKTTIDTFHCLYVGVVSESKGIGFIIKALHIVSEKGYNVILTIVGQCTSSFKQRIKQEYPGLNVDIKGRVPFAELKTIYGKSDIGLIASLQEQASYVAIEMAMSGLPIITTAVDGLDEIFTDEINALKVNIRFSSVFGLSVDVDMMAKQIIRLIESPSLRLKLSYNVRKLYQQKLNLELMISKTVSVYYELVKEK